MAVKTPAPQRAAGRKRLAKQGSALPDGSFPIPNTVYLGKAIQAVGRASAGKRPALARLIRKRARQLGPAGMARLKGSWADNKQTTKAMANALYGQLIELGFAPELAKSETQATMTFTLIELAKSEMGKDDNAPPNRKKPNAMSQKLGAKKSGTQKAPNWDPDHDGDNDASPSGDVDNDFSGKLNPLQRAAMKRMITKGMAPAMAYKSARRVKAAA